MTSALIDSLQATTNALRQQDASEGSGTWPRMIDAVRYLVAGGITWRSMPVDFPRWDGVYAFFPAGVSAG